MPKYRLSQHSMDVVFKLEAQQLGSALARRFDIDLPPVVRYFPTDLPVADVHLEQLDSVFELEDGRLLHLEFQTIHRKETLPRFLVYDAYLYERYRRPIATIVIYGAGVAAASGEIAGGAIHYNVSNILLGQQDGEMTLRRLSTLVEKGAGLKSEDRLDIVFLPLMQHQRPRREVVAETIALARRLPERQQRQAVASLIGLGHRFLAQTELDTLLEGLMSTNLGQRLIERGIEQGREEGVALARETVLQVLALRFGSLPPSIATRLAAVNDVQELKHLRDAAFSGASLDEFTRVLG
jgi:hypothetical protein